MSCCRPVIDQCQGRPSGGAASCCSSPLASGATVRAIVLFTLFALRVAIIVGLIATGAIDFRFFTYLSITGVTILQTAGLIGLFVPAVMRFYARFLFPVAFQTTVLVAVLITILVQLNETIFTAHLIFFGGDLSAATLHTGDWITHQFPALEILVNIIAIGHLLRGHVRAFWLALGTLGRALYAVWILEGVMVPLGIYAAVEQWAQRYPTDLPPVLSWMLIVLVAGIIGTFFLLFLISADDYVHFTGLCAHVAPCEPCARAAACAPLRACAPPVLCAPPSACGAELVATARVEPLAVVLHRRAAGGAMHV